MSVFDHKFDSRNAGGLLAESRLEVAAQAVKIAALQAEVARLRAELTGKDVAYSALSRENEEHRLAATQFRKDAKDAARERARADNLQSALDAATKRCTSLEEAVRQDAAAKRCASLEESARRLLAEHDAETRRPETRA